MRFATRHSTAWSHAWVLAGACAVGGAAGCGDGAHGGASGARSTHGGSSVGGQVVSTVNGHAITLDEVNALVAGSGLSASEALRRLQEERLLVAEAQRRGAQREWAVAEVARKAAVQALLSSEAGAVSVSDTEIEAAYAQQRDRFEKPEKRASVHLLARLPADASPSADAAARAIVERMLPELEAAQDLDALLRSYRRKVIDGVAIVAEHVPAVPQVGRLAQPFADAMFALAAPGTVPQPVRTSFGWHAIRVTEIVPAIVTPQAEAYATLGKELLVTRQQQRVTELLAQLGKTYPVQLSGNAAQSLAGLSF